MLIEADAFRTDGLITIILIGRLPTPYDEVEELGFYPGNGSGSARFFLRKGRKAGQENIQCILGPGKIWDLSRVVRDKYSKTVEIFINDQFVKKIGILEFTVRGMYDILEF